MVPRYFVLPADYDLTICERAVNRQANPVQSRLAWPIICGRLVHIRSQD